MTNSALLKEYIDKSGYKKQYIASFINLTYQGFLNKLNNKYDFTVSEIKGLCKLLNISAKDRDRIFFAQ